MTESVTHYFDWGMKYKQNQQVWEVIHDSYSSTVLEYNFKSQALHF